MGLSASQARLLSITARLSNNELHSQEIANAKIRLADQTEQASEKYIEAMSASKFVYTTYDANGEQECVDLTPALMYTYSPLKNQYGISNTNGQILVSTKDCTNYENSANLIEFLRKNGIEVEEKVETPAATGVTQEEWDAAVEGYARELFGARYTNFVDMETGKIKSDITLVGDVFLDTYVDKRYDISSQAEYDDLISHYNDLFNTTISTWQAASCRGNKSPKNTEGLYGDLLYYMQWDIPEFDYVKEYLPLANAGITSLDALNELVNAGYSSSGSISDVDTAFRLLGSKNGYDEATMASSSGPNDFDRAILAIEKNLSDLIYAKHGSKATFTYSNSDGDLTLNRRQAATESNVSISGNGSISQSNYSKTVRSCLKARNELFDSTLGLDELYAHVIAYIKRRNESGHITALHGTSGNVNSDNIEVDSNGKITSDAISGSFATSSKDTWDIGGERGYANNIIAMYKNFVNEFSRRIKKDRDNVNAAVLDAYNNEIYPWKDSNINPWAEACHNKYDNFLAKLGDLNDYVNSHSVSHVDTTPIVTYEVDYEDPMAQWYVNLWHRMNGESDERVESNTTQHYGKLYKLLEDNLLTSSSWLKFALQNGIVTLEKVYYVSEEEAPAGLRHSKWKSIAYSSAEDIHEVEDKVAKSKAEAEYKEKLYEIEAKDKKYDTEMRQLDAEHDALKTKYESIKSVINNNVGRSFKAFS